MHLMLLEKCLAAIDLVESVDINHATNYPLNQPSHKFLMLRHRRFHSSELLREATSKP